jgi:hypothetical protein
MSHRAAYHLPGLDPNAVEEWRYIEADGMRLRWPVLSSSQLATICDTLIRNRDEHLLMCSVNELVNAIDQTSGALREHIDETSKLLSAFTGYSQPVARETLSHMLDDWRAPALEQMLRSELGHPAVLDHPIVDAEIPGRRVAAYGFPFAFHIFSGNVPGVAVTSLIRSLLVKSATLGKTAAGEPLLPVLFAEQLARVAPRIATCVGVTYWPGGTAELEDVAINAADAVVVYGGEASVQAIQAHAANKHIVVHGPRLSFGIVGPHAAPDLARDVAQAVAAYDQQGCVSPHVIYVVGAPELARAFARTVATELEHLSATLPRGPLSTAEAIAIRNARAAAEFADGGAVELLGSEQAGYSVIVEQDPAFKLSCLNRLLYVKPVPEALLVPDLLPPRRFLQSAAVEGFPATEKAELVRRLGLSGVSRITSFAKLPWPPMHWHHDGSAPLRELITWQDVED